MVDKINFQMGRTEWIMLLALSFLWGMSFINLKITLTEMQPLTLVFFRTAIASLGLIVWCFIRKKNMHLSFKEHLLMVVLGVIMTAIPFSFFAWGMQHISTSVAAVFNGTVPFFTAIFAHFLLGQTERLTLGKTIGLGFGLLGIFTIAGFDSITNFDLSNMGQLAIIIACFFYSISGIFIRLFVPNSLDNTVISTYSLIWAALVIGGVTLYFDGMPSFGYSPKVWFSISVLGLLSTAVTYIILFRLIKRAGASNTSLTTFIIPIFAITIGIIFLGESLNTNEVIGIFLILIGVGFIQGLYKRFI